MKIAVLVNGIAHEAHRRLLKGIGQYAGEKNIQVFVFTCMNLYEKSEYGIGEVKIFRLPDYAQYDGIIFIGNPIRYVQYDGGIMRQIRELGIPAISIENRIKGIPTFYTDNRGAMWEMVSHLIGKHGVRNICYLSGPEDSTESNERLQGARDAAGEYGLSLDDDHIYYGNYLTDSGGRLVEHLMEAGGELPEAIVCANDFMALGVYMALSRYGVQIGRDILLTGYDCMSDMANLIPAITTLEKPQEQIGYEACRSLTEGKVTDSREFKVKCHFRGSCGCPEHKIHNLPELQLRDMQQKLENYGMGEFNKYMVSDLNECDNMQEFCRCLKRYIVQMDFSYVYLCLCEEKRAADKAEYGEQVEEDYSDRIYIPVAYEKGTFTEYPYFERGELLPEVCRKKLESELCIVEPIHFRRKCLGYLVTCGSEVAFHPTLFQNWMNSISSALENIRKQDELKRLVKKLNNVWMLDSLTQTYNRAGFFHYANGILENCKMNHASIGVLFVDINKLKLVNDSYGHKEGDFYIKSVADSMGKLKGQEQLLMRYGGDEFVVLGSFEKGNEFSGLMEALNPELEECRKRNGKAYEMSVSIGFHAVPVTKEFKLDQLMEQADREMYEMKKRRGNSQK